MTAKKDSEMVKVKILKDKQHKHTGRVYKGGAELTLTIEQAQWLVGEKKVEIVK